MTKGIQSRRTLANGHGGDLPEGTHEANIDFEPGLEREVRPGERVFERTTDPAGKAFYYIQAPSLCKSCPLTPGPPIPRTVLDTNVVLGWLLFGDPACVSIGAAIQSGRTIWLASELLRGELAHVLARGVKDWPGNSSAILGYFDQLAVRTGRVPVPRHPLRCTDPDDQKFIDLAVEGHAAALVSRDRAVLRLANRARSHGLLIIKPEEWSLVFERTHTAPAA